MEESFLISAEKGFSDKTKTMFIYMLMANENTGRMHFFL